ncbi:MAG: hypothetical protein KGI25_03820 [Thaumarchaeota archaeon]|nr:hypothetical protein [Nitrososphaerota archaeon]
MLLVRQTLSAGSAKRDDIRNAWERFQQMPGLKGPTTVRLTQNLYNASAHIDGLFHSKSS